MDWFRALLAENARSFQIVVFTCRPSDYPKPSAKIPKGKSVHMDTDDGFLYERSTSDGPCAENSGKTHRALTARRTIPLTVSDTRNFG